MKKYKYVLLFILFSIKTFACLNGETKYLKNGTFIYEDGEGVYPEGHDFYVENFPKLILELDNLYKKTKDIDYLSDKGYVLTIQKKYNEALKIYLEIEKKEPNRYSTASNIGTIYELIGENQKAYNWIKKAIQINSKSHNESEWLHLKILEAKLKGDSYINSNFLINTNFGSDTIPKTQLNKKDLEKLSKALYYQLNERITFIKPKNKIIANLLFDLGNIAYLQGELSIAIEIYNKAKEYGYSNKLLYERKDLSYEKLIQQQNQLHSNEIDKTIKLKNPKNSFTEEEIKTILYTLLVLTIIALSLLIFLIIFIVKWKKEKNRHKNISNI